MIILAGIVFTVVVCWLVVLIAGGALGLLARPVVRHLRRLRGRRVTRRQAMRRAPGVAWPRYLRPNGARPSDPRPRLNDTDAALPDGWWTEFERQFRIYAQDSEHGAGRRRHPRDGA